jgi:hypothetical protein
MVAVPRATSRAQHPSGKFSYNWPAENKSSVTVGRVMKDMGDSSVFGTGPQSAPQGNDQKWKPVFK